MGKITTLQEQRLVLNPILDQDVKKNKRIKDKFIKLREHWRMKRLKGLRFFVEEKNDIIKLQMEES